MFNPQVIDRRLNRLAEVIRRGIDPRFTFKDYSIAEVEGWVERLDELWDPQLQSMKRQFTVEEEAFVRHELNRCKADFLYWSTRYAFLKSKKAELIRFHPTAVQSIILQKIDREEYNAVINKSGDGVLLAIMKARQLGCSTLSEIIIAHRVFFYSSTTALIAADVDTRNANLYEMLCRVLDNLPYWMKPRSSDPKKDYRVKNQQLYFADQDSVIRLGSSSNMQGGDSGEIKGSLGTGMTLPLVHLSELALWANPEQINDALLPSIPMSARTFVIFESTAKGRGNWWHQTWERSKRGLGRLKPVFIPWYTDPETYTIKAPSEWSPSSDAIFHSNYVKETSSKWTGKVVELTRDQLFWWERTRAEYIDGKMLNKFLAEYAYDDTSAFQASTVSVFPTEMIEEMRQRTAHQPTLVEIKPKMKIDAENSGWSERGLTAPNG